MWNKIYFFSKWIHGQKNNPLFEIAVENNLIKKGYEKIFPEEKDYKFNMNLTKEDLHKDKILQSIKNESKSLFLLNFNC